MNVNLTNQECRNLATFLALITNDSGFDDTYGLSGSERAAIRRATGKLTKAADEAMLVGSKNARPSTPLRRHDMETKTALRKADPMTESHLYEKAKALVDDWRDRVSLAYEGDWPQMDELAAEVALLREEDEPIRLVGDAVRQAWEPAPRGYTREQYERDKQTRHAR